MQTLQRLAYSRVVIVSGWMGSGATHWQRWLERRCKALGTEAHCPKLPGRFGEPKLPAWLNALERLAPVINETTALVGHSLGCTTILHLLRREHIQSVGLVVLVSPVSRARIVENADKYPTPEIQQAILRFYDDLDTGPAGRKARRIDIYASDNDIWVDPLAAQTLALELEAHFHLIPGGGHLSVSTGYYKFPTILDLLKAQSFLH